MQHDLPRTVPLLSAPSGHGNTLSSRIAAVVEIARFHGTEIDPSDLSIPASGVHSAAELSAWITQAGLWSRAVRIRWNKIVSMKDLGPVILLLNDGSAVIMTGTDLQKNCVGIRQVGQSASQAILVDELRMSTIWEGEVLLVRPERGTTENEVAFSLRWLISLVTKEHRAMRDIAIASLTLSFLTVFPPLLVMNVVDKVLTHRSGSTLVLLAVFLGIAALYETFLGCARRVIVLVVGARLDARLNLHVFNRLLKLPLDYFERHPSGETMHKVAQVYKVRDFLTGKLMTTLLDLVTLFVLLPILFYLNAALSWIVLGCGITMTLIIVAFLRPLRNKFASVVKAETEKASVLSESIYGIKTLKSLALEPQKKALWDQRVTDVGRARLEFGMLSNIPQTMIAPVERFMSTGVILIGAYFAMTETTGYAVGALFAYMMLSGRVAQPLAGIARLIEDYEEINSSIGEAASVLNRPQEAEIPGGGLRPSFAGGISFSDVKFTYEGSRVPALDGVTFSVPPGTMLGIVGRSGSGKSTLTRLLQGISRDYSGSIKIDGVDLREINLRHLRQSFGVVLQENFLFRGSVRDNVISGRTGLAMEDAVKAVRLAGAEEFVERLPQGYETFIQEGSPNLSGGQRQRLAIARAVITDPRLLILDEATSALDPESEALVNANLLRIAQGRTMVIVSHRLSSLTECHQIMVMDNGGIVDIAPHRVLLERCTIYRQLWNQQNRHMNPVLNAPSVPLATLVHQA